MLARWLLMYIYLKIKSEDWGGAFVDLQPEEDVPNRSILRAIVESDPEPLVSCAGLTWILVFCVSQIFILCFLEL